MSRPGAATSEPHNPLTTREGWARFVSAKPLELQLVPEERLALLNGFRRDDYERDRLDYHAQLIVVATPTVRQVAHSGRRLALLNRGQISARRGLIVTGTAGTGKTTAITQLGKQHEHQARRRRQGKAPFQPVVFVTIPPAATAKMVAAEFARFLGIPLPSRPNQIEITNMVCDVLCDLGTDLVIVDEIHNLNLGSRTGAETSDQLKYLSERIPATFLYAGIDVESAGLFTGTRGRQIAGRFATLTTSPFAYGTQTERNDWSSLIATLEDALKLYRHRPGSLVRLAPYLHQRTSGMIGSLSHLIREAAIEAILNGSEKLTKPLLERVTLDHAAETSRPKAHRSRAGRHPGKVA